MINYAILKDSNNNNNVAVVGHDTESGRVIFKARNKFVSDVLEILFARKFFRLVEEDDIEYKEQVKKHDKDLLEIALPLLEEYQVVEYWEDVKGSLDSTVDDQFNEKIKK